MKHLFLWLSLLCILGACGTTESAPERTNPSAPTATAQAPVVAPTEASAPPAEVPAPAGSGPLVRLVSEGGIAGTTTTTEVWDDGTITLSQGQGDTVFASGQAVADATTLAELNTLLASPEFQALDEQYLPPQTVADGITYTVTTPNKTIIAADTAEFPQPLVQLLTLIGQLQSQISL